MALWPSGQVNALHVPQPINTYYHSWICWERLLFLHERWPSRWIVISAPGMSATTRWRSWSQPSMLLRGRSAT